MGRCLEVRDLNTYFYTEHVAAQPEVVEDDEDEDEEFDQDEDEDKDEVEDEDDLW